MSSQSAFVVGECGTGKTLIGAIAAHLVSGGNYRALVVGPPHLTRKGKQGSKWCREILATIPGVEVIHLDDHRQLLRLPETLARLDKPVWVVTSRNFLKMGPPVRAAFNTRHAKVRLRRPDGVEYQEIMEFPCCPKCGKLVTDADGVPRTEKYLTKARRKCDGTIERADGTTQPCGERLWNCIWPENQTNNTRSHWCKPVFLPAQWMKGRLRFDVGIFDEVHELKGGGTAQGQMLGSVAACCDKVLALTGTLFGGKASDLYYLMWRLCPDRMKALGFDYHRSLQEFVSQYGILQRIVDQDEDVRGRRSRRRETARSVEKPGIVPALFTDLLLDKAVFLTLDEMVPHLPAGALPPRPRIEVELCDLGPLQKPYEQMSNEILGAVKRSSQGGNSPNMGLVSAMFNALDCWPDHPFGFNPIYQVSRDKETGEKEYEIVCVPPEMPDVRYDKDHRLVELVQREIQQGRRCIVYTVHTIKRPVPDRLLRFLDHAGIKTAFLHNVPTDRREEWVARQEAEGVQCIVTHPGKVETGLDLIGWPTLIFHSIGTKPFTFRQASARAWRIGQRANCRTILMCYRETMQEMIASLMFTKLKASTRLEGQILEDLAAIGDSDDITDQILRAVKADERPAIAPEAIAPTPEHQEPPQNAGVCDSACTVSTGELDALLAELTGLGYQDDPLAQLDETLRELMVA